MHKFTAMAAACKFCCLALLVLCTLIMFTTADDKDDDLYKDLLNRPHSHLDHHRKPGKAKPKHPHRHIHIPKRRHPQKHTPKPRKIVPTITKTAAKKLATVSMLSQFYLFSISQKYDCSLITLAQIFSILQKMHS